MGGTEKYEHQREKRYNAASINYAQHPKTCKHCDKEIPYEKRENNYCNLSCAASETNKGVCRSKEYFDKLRGFPKPPGVKRLPLKSKACKFCGKTIIPSHPKVLFCNNTCASLHRTRTLIESGKATRNNKGGIKSYLVKTLGHQCEDCKLTEWKQQKIPLELHHIDGNVDNMKSENMMLLCPNCHVFTDTYKFKNHMKKTGGECRRGQTGET